MKKLMITIVVLTLTISMAIGFASPVGANGPIYLEYYDDSGGGAGGVEAAVASADGVWWDLAADEYVIFQVPDPYVVLNDNTSNPEIRIDTLGNGVLVHDAEMYVSEDLAGWTYAGTYSDNIDANIDLDSIPYDGVVRYVAVIGAYTTDPQLMYDLDAAELLIIGGFAVEIDIKPMSSPNSLNVNSKGLLPVAILGTDIFDVSMVDPASVQLMGVSPVSWALKDVATPGQEEAGPDGYMDLVLHFDTQELSAALGEVLNAQVLTLELTGNLQAGYGGN
ncbi:MAG: hypothetical protein OEV56_03440, partial [Dehalococcoidia bacterium]|nr:hypothetical protein [Dehalococcoidia bacterium]